MLELLPDSMGPVLLVFRGAILIHAYASTGPSRGFIGLSVQTYHGAEARRVIPAEAGIQSLATRSNVAGTLTSLGPGLRRNDEAERAGPLSCWLRLLPHEDPNLHSRRGRSFWAEGKTPKSALKVI